MECMLRLAGTRVWHPFASWLVLCGTAATSFAQSGSMGELGARLAPAYAQMQNLTLVPDLSTAHYRVDDGSGRMHVDVTRLGYETPVADLGQGSALLARLTAGHLRMTTDLPVAVSGPGNVATQWSAYGISGGVAGRFELGHGVTVVPALDAGLTRLANQSDYSGSGVLLQPFLDGPIFNWNSDAWVLTPHLGIDWVPDTPGRRIAVHAHTAWSRVATYGESDRARRFTETAGVYSVRAEHAMPTTLRLFERQVEWALFGGHSGFLGPGRSTLGFSSVAEVGIGLQVPLSSKSEASKRLRVGFSYLFGTHVRGWTVSMGLPY